MEARLRRLKLGNRGKGRGRGAGKEEKKETKQDKKPRKKEMRNWNQLLTGDTNDEPQKLDFACDSPLELIVDDEEDEEAEDVKAGGGFLASMVGCGLLPEVRSLKVNVVGGESITKEDIQPALEALKKKLMERNVGHDIVDKIADSVSASLEGTKLGSFTRVSKVVYKAVEESLTRILSPARSIDILRE
eukprot:scaffold492429_cov50-Prasinocladus_malaysianus.AAC.1